MLGFGARHPIFVIPGLVPMGAKISPKISIA